MNRFSATLLIFTLWAPTNSRAAEPRSGRKDPVVQKIVRRISATEIEKNIRTLVSFGSRHTLSETNSPTRGIGAARNWIMGEFNRYNEENEGRLRVEVDTFVQPSTNRVPQPAVLMNIVATLSGRRPGATNRIYVVSGHYDSCVCKQDMLDATSDAPGANDDASGTAAVMEMARVMSRFEFDATIVFMAVAGEEQGLLGSSHWAEMAHQNKWNIEAMFTNDIIGSSRSENGDVDRGVVRLFAQGIPPQRDLSTNQVTILKTGGENDSAPRQLARYIRETTKQYVRGIEVEVIYRTDRYGRGGDHSPFLDRGYPALRFTERAEDYRHQHERVRLENGVQYGDLPEFVDFKYVAQIARVNAAALASLALAPAVPSEAHIETARQENDTTLNWKQNSEEDLAGYQIVWRKTTSPFWEHRLAVGNTNRFTLKGISKDNFIFGVEAVDQQGHHSPAAYPLPSRTARTR